MKYLLLFLIVLAVLWLARGSRRVPPSAQRDPVAPKQTMLACAQCGLHLPRDDALPGRGGVFCSEQHRAEYERANSGP